MRMLTDAFPARWPIAYHISQLRLNCARIETTESREWRMRSIPLNLHR